MGHIFKEGYLEPKYEKVKSYYKKAVVTYVFGSYNLFSYGTRIVKLTRKGDGNYVQFMNTRLYSRTTLRHLREFAKQFGNQMFIDFVKKPKSEMIDVILSRGEFEDFRFASEPDSTDSSGRIDTYYI